MTQPQKLKTQQSMKSLGTHQQQTYHVIPATVSTNQHQGNQSNVTNITEKNLSIINRSENQIPSIHDEQRNKGHKQNQSKHHQEKMQNESNKLIENEEKKKEQNKPQNKQSHKDTIKQQELKQNNVQPNQDLNHAKNTEKNNQKVNSIEHKDKLIATQQKKEETIKEKPQQSQKKNVVQQIQDIKTSPQVNNQSIISKDLTKQKKIEDSHHQQNLDDKKGQKKQLKAQDDQALPKNQQVKIQHAPSKKDVTGVETSKQHKKDEKDILVNSKLNQQTKSQQAEEANKLEKQSPQKGNKNQLQIKQKGSDSLHKQKNQPVEKISKHQSTVNDKKLPSQQNKSDIKLNWNTLLKLFIQKLAKLRKQKKNQHKKQTKSNNDQDRKIDLNLQLGSSDISSQHDYENRIKLQFKLFENEVKKENTIEKKQNQQSHDGQQSNKESQKHQYLPTKLSFSLYDHKTNKQHHNKKSQQNTTHHNTNSQKLKHQLQQLTKAFNKNQFSFKINQPHHNDDKSKDQQMHDKKYSYKKLQKTKIDIMFSTDFISQQLKIQKQRFQQLENILSKLNQKQGKQQQHNQQNDKKKNNNNTIFTSFCQLLTAYPLKTIEPIKFLQLLLGGFKLRVFKEQTQLSSHYQGQSQLIGQVLYQTLLSIFPQQVSHYVKNMLGGTGTIKFRSIDNLTRLLTRLGINEMLAETPTVKELLNELLENLKQLFWVKQNESEQINNDNNSTISPQLSPLWTIFSTVFSQKSHNTTQAQLTLFNTLTIKLSLQCKSQTINNLYQQLQRQSPKQ